MALAPAAPVVAVGDFITARAVAAASRASRASTASAPSATTMRQCPRVSSRVSRYASSDDSRHGASGSSVTLTSRDASDADSAMKPDCRPISLTRPTPLRAASASVCAHVSGCTACSTAVSNPNDRSISGMSLSMVWGDG
jgi:hypothetical protein